MSNPVDEASKYFWWMITSTTWEITYWTAALLFTEITLRGSHSNLSSLLRVMMPSLSFCPSTSGWKTALNDRMEECSLAISVDGCAEHLVSTCNPLLLHSALAFRIERQSRENPNLPEKTVDLDSLSSKVFSSFGFSPDFSKSYSFSKR